MKIFTIEIDRRHEDGGAWETMGVFSLTSDGVLTSIQGDPDFLKLITFIDKEVGGPVTHDSHPEAWLRQLAVEFNGPGRRLTVEERSEDS